MSRDPGPFGLRRPAPPLSDFVDFLWIHDWYVPAQAEERLLPDGSADIVFRTDAGGQPAASVSGPRSRYVVLEATRPFSIAAVHFKPGGVFPFVDCDLSDLENTGEQLSTFWGSFALETAERLARTRSIDDRFRTLEAALLRTFHCGRRPHRAVVHGLDLVRRSRGTAPVADIAGRTGLSPRRLSQLFHAEVGLSPKALCRIERFNEVLARVDGRPVADWTDIAASCGYFDQAHFNHDFREFSGLSPTAYLRHRIARNHVVVEGG